MVLYAATFMPLFSPNTQVDYRNMSNISTKLKSIRDEIKEYEQRYNRTPGAVTLLAVSKTKPLEAVNDAITSGQCHFGENYLDDALPKVKATQDSSCVWHFIGHIQSNKTKAIAEHFAWVHTLDRTKIARRLSTQRPNGMPPLNCCVQLNFDNEAAKSGVSEKELPALMENISELPGLDIRGLMVIPELRKNLEAQREVFARVREIFIKMKEKYPKFDTLSMGMSADMEAAIAEGATIVRIGTAVFGSRNQVSQ